MIVVVVIIKLAKFVVRVEVVVGIVKIVLEFVVTLIVLLEGKIVALLLEHDHPA